MYVRTRDDALDALAVILELPDRASQIIEITMRIAVCLDPDPRNFLVDCQAALIEGGLEALRKRRMEHLSSLAKYYARSEPPPAEPYPACAPSRLAGDRTLGCASPPDCQ